MSVSIRQRVRILCASVGIAVALVVMNGCTSSGTTGSPASVTTTSATSISASGPIPAAPQNDLKDNSAHHNVALDGETFRMKVDYFTTVDATTWTALGPKNVHLLAYLNPAQDTKAPTVVIDQFSAETSLLAANSDLDGLVIDRAQDIAGSQVPGFLVTSQISYGTVVSTAGVTDSLLARWQSLDGPLPVDEAALQRAGVYAVRMSFTYRLLVRNVGDANWHRRTVLDQLTIPLDSVAAPPAATSSAAASSAATSPTTS